MFRTAFQVVELVFDADENVIDRRVIPYPYPTRKEAVGIIESFAKGFASSGYEPKGDFWWGIARDDKTRVRFIIERV
jgi:hypothetical protein